MSSISVEKILPQSYPFIMIDRIVDFKKDSSLTAVKNVTGNEWVYDSPDVKSGLYPETLIIEGAAQSAIAFYRMNNQPDGQTENLFVLGKIKSEFVQQTHIGDQLVFKTLEYKMLKNSGFVDIEVSKDAEKIADIQVFFSLQEKVKAEND